MEGAFDAAWQKLQATIAQKLGRRQAGMSGRTVVGLLGRGIQASRTPAMHEREGARLGMGFAYVLIDFDELGLADGDLARMVGEAERLGFAGLNVTHPFKQSVLDCLDELSPEAAAIGAVNTIVFSHGRRTGHNTDSWGFAEAFREGLAGVRLGSVVQFGAGGGGAAVAHALLACGVGALTICDTNAARGQALAQRLGQRFGRQVRAVDDAVAELRVADGVVNATPLGMHKYPGMPMPAAALEARHWVAEIVYFPAETELLRRAKGLGCRTLSGTQMAIYQAVKAFELFTGIAPDRTAMTAHFRAAA